ncbi:hypothetical protein [Bacillus massiliigorillae]|uniref:hypothetical protein n=1 Tax=Bacillus massiliigorillae TaxID=1243664 RepID=UPI0003A31BDD|nr:hypothetical protein [Bacillus massiliigorillae]
MKIHKSVIVKQEVELLESITCNKCGKTTVLNGDEFERQIKAEGFQTIECEFGYGSKYDCEKWTFDICQECLLEFTKSFKYPHEVKEMC